MFLFVTDEVVAAHRSCKALVRTLRLEYDEAGEVTHVALGPEDGMHEVGRGGKRLPWRLVKALAQARYKNLSSKYGRLR